MRFLFFSWLSAVVAFLAVPPSHGQEAPNPQPLCELRLTEGPAGKPSDGLYTPALTFAQGKDGLTLFFSTWNGFARWDLPRRLIQGETVVEKRFTQLTVVPGGSVRYLTTSENSRTVLASYGPVPMPFTWNQLKPPPFPVAPYFEVWDAETGKVILTLKGDKERSVWYGTISADGKTVLTAEHHGAKQQVGFWDVASGKFQRALTDLHGPLALSPDGKLLAAMNGPFGKYRFLVVDAATGRERATLSRPKSLDAGDDTVEWIPGEFRFAPDGQSLAGSCPFERKGHWVVWDLQGKLLLGDDPKKQPSAFCFLPKPPAKGVNWLARGGWIRSIAISPDGKLAAVGEDGAIRVYASGR